LKALGPLPNWNTAERHRVAAAQSMWGISSQLALGAVSLDSP